jgi:hypothetical protein
LGTGALRAAVLMKEKVFFLLQKYKNSAYTAEQKK